MPGDRSHRPLLEWATRVETIASAQRAIDAELKSVNQIAEALSDTTPELAECGSSAPCQVRVAIRFRDKLRALRAAIWTTILGTGKAQQEAERNIRKIAEVYVAENWESLKQVHDFKTQEVGVIQATVSDEIVKLARGEGWTLSGFLQLLVKPFKEGAKALSFRELRRPDSDFSSGKNDARRDWLYQLGLVLMFQVGLHGFTLLRDWVSNEPIQFLSMLWVYATTIFFTALRGEMGARNQKPEEKLEIKDLTDAIRALPGVLHGEKGYVRESFVKMVGFLALFPFEVAASVVTRTINILAVEGPASFGAQRLLAISLKNLQATLLWNAYLAVRFSIWDKWFTLNLLPNWMRERKTEAAVAVAELRALYKPIFREELVLEDTEIYRALVPWWQRPVDAAISCIRAPQRAIRAIRSWMDPHILDEQEDASQARTSLKALVDSPEAKRFIDAHAKRRVPEILGAAWRVASSFLNAILLFSVFADKDDGESAPTQR